MTGSEYLTQRAAARLLGISWETFDKRRKAGDPICQPDYVDPDSGRRTYNQRALEAALDELGRQKVRGS